MARRPSISAGARSQGSLKNPPPSGPWGALQALLDDGGQVTLGAIGPIRAAATASMPAGMLAGLMRKDGERWEDLLIRLNDAVMKAVVEGYQINDLHK